MPSAVNLGGQASEEVVLKACPGCGKDSTRVIGGPGTAGGPKYWAGCDYCNWRTWGDTQAEAISAWNTRTPHPSGDTGEIGEVVKMLRVGSPELNHAFTITSRDSYRAATLIEQQAATIAERDERIETLELRNAAREAEIEAMAERIATLERTKQP